MCFSGICDGLARSRIRFFKKVLVAGAGNDNDNGRVLCRCSAAAVRTRGTITIFVFSVFGGAHGEENGGNVGSFSARRCCGAVW